MYILTLRGLSYLPFIITWTNNHHCSSSYYLVIKIVCPQLLLSVVLYIFWLAVFVMLICIQVYIDNENWHTLPPKYFILLYLYPQQWNKGGILDSPYLSVHLSVCLPVCPLTFRVHPVVSTVQEWFFQYLVQTINIISGCIACDDPWPRPIPSRPLGLDLENRVHSVAFTVLGGFFGLTLKKNVQFSMDYFHI